MDRRLRPLDVAATEGGYVDPDGVEQISCWRLRGYIFAEPFAPEVLLTDESWGPVVSGNPTVAGSNGANAAAGRDHDDGGRSMKSWPPLTAFRF